MWTRSTAPTWSARRTRRWTRRAPGWRGTFAVSTLVIEARSGPAGLIELAERHAASAVVLGSSSAGAFGRVALGSVSDRLVHSSPVPVALAPRGYHCKSGLKVQRVTAAFGGSDEADDLVLAAAGVAASVGASLRLASFAVRARAPFTAGVGSGPEQTIVRQWVEDIERAAREALDEIRDLPEKPPSLEAVVGYGETWDDALEDIEWDDGDVLVVGSSTVGPVARVFLGSRSAKIVRHAPVPVVVVPRRAAEELAAQAVRLGGAPFQDAPDARGHGARIAEHLAPGEAEHGVAVALQRHVAGAVVLEGQPVPVGLVAVGFDGDAFGAPEEVDQVGPDPNADGGLRQAGGCELREAARVRVASASGRLRRRRSACPSPPAPRWPLNVRERSLEFGLAGEVEVEGLGHGLAQLVRRHRGGEVEQRARRRGQRQPVAPAPFQLRRRSARGSPAASGPLWALIGGPRGAPRRCARTRPRSGG